MKHYLLKNEQFSRLHGFTDLVIVNSTDFTQSANNTAQALNLNSVDLAKGDIVYPQLLIEVRTATVGLATCTVSLGITGAVTQFSSANDTIAGNVYFTPANSVAPYPVVATGKRVIANFVPGASEALTTATAGEYWFWLKISRLADRQIQA